MPRPTEGLISTEKSVRAYLCLAMSGEAGAPKIGQAADYIDACGDRPRAGLQSIMARISVRERADGMNTTHDWPTSRRSAVSSAGGRNDESRIVQRAKDMDEDALASLYSSYHPRIYNYAFLQLGDVYAAEDLASDVMLKVLESIDGYQFRGRPFSAWVYRIARNKLVDLHRKRKRNGNLNLWDPPTATELTPEALAERALDRGQLQIALKYLTEGQRQVIVLKFIEGFDNATVSHVLGKSEGAVKSVQHRALRSLRRILSPNRR